MADTDLSTLLLKWYDANGRSLPWRVKGGAHPEPLCYLGFGVYAPTNHSQNRYTVFSPLYGALPDHSGVSSGRYR